MQTSENRNIKTLLVVYHSMTGGTLQMAHAAARGAQSTGDVRVSLMHAASAGIADMLEASAYLFATPENLAAMSGMMKDFFDRTYYGVLERVNGRPYATLICAGSDGSNAAQQIARIATGWRLKSIAEPLIVCTRAQEPAQILAAKTIPAEGLLQCEELGATLAAGTALGIY